MSERTTSLLRELFNYDPATRGLKTGAHFGTGLGVDDITGLNELFERCLKHVLKTSQSTLSRELGEIIRFRSIFALLPEECLYGDPEEDKPLIRAHLVAIGLTPDEDIVRAVKFLCANFRAQRLKRARKTGISEVYIKHHKIFTAIFDQQNGRCRYCGELLIYGGNMQLDHILPWHLGDDPADGSNWQFLCDECNQGKAEYPYYSLRQGGANWIRPSGEPGLSREVRFAALARDGACVVTKKKPSEVKLVVQKRVETGCWILDNVLTVAEGSATINEQ